MYSLFHKIQHCQTASKPVIKENSRISFHLLKLSNACLYSLFQICCSICLNYKQKGCTPDLLSHQKKKKVKYDSNSWTFFFKPSITYMCNPAVYFVCGCWHLWWYRRSLKHLWDLCIFLPEFGENRFKLSIGISRGK